MGKSLLDRWGGASRSSVALLTKALRLDSPYPGSTYRRH